MSSVCVREALWCILKCWWGRWCGHEGSQVCVCRWVHDDDDDCKTCASVMSIKPLSTPLNDLLCIEERWAIVQCRSQCSLWPLFLGGVINIPALDCTPDYFTQALGIDSLVFLCCGKGKWNTHTKLESCFAARQVRENGYENKITWCFSGLGCFGSGLSFQKSTYSFGTAGVHCGTTWTSSNFPHLIGTEQLSRPNLGFYGGHKEKLHIKKTSRPAIIHSWHHKKLT